MQRNDIFFIPSHPPTLRNIHSCQFAGKSTSPYVSIQYMWRHLSSFIIWIRLSIHTLPHIHTQLCGLLHSAHLFLHRVQSWGRPCPSDVCLLPWWWIALSVRPVLSVHWGVKMWPDAVSWFSTRLSGEMQLCSQTVCICLVKLNTSSQNTELKDTTGYESSSRIQNKWFQYTVGASC